MANPSSRWYERHPRTALSLVVIAGIACLLGMAEGLSRYLFPQWAPVTAERADFWQFDPDLGWSLVPNRQGNFQHPDFSTEVSINSLGLRSREYPVARNEKKRMLVLGDSYGWGFGVNNNEIFTELMEAKHPDWEIINASVSGYGTVQEYLYLQKRGVLLKPDVVLLLFFDNDFQDNIGKTDYWYKRPIISRTASGFAMTGTPVSPPSLLQRFNIMLMGHSYLARGFYGALASATGDNDSSTNANNGDEHIDTNADNGFDATRFVLGQMMDFTQSQGIKLVIAETPLSEVKHAVIQQQCETHKVPCLHLNKVFRRNTRDWHFEHDRHWNALGHKMAADALDAFLQENGMWDGKSVE
jgi:hypothetical protein